MSAQAHAPAPAAAARAGKGPTRSAGAWWAALRDEAGVAALLSLAAAAWLLVGLARAGWFGLWWLALPLMGAALALGLMAWWRSPLWDKGAALLLLAVAALLYLPPAQQVALSGDAGIYSNEAAWLARTGGVRGAFEPLAPLSPATRDLFYIDSSEQFDGRYTMRAYDGLVYGGYYVVEPGGEGETPIIRQSRLAQTSVWQAFLLKLAGMPANFWVGFGAGAIALWLLYATARRIAPPWLALWSALLLAVSLPQVYFFRSALSEPVGQVWTLAGLLCAVRWLQEAAPRRPWLLAAALIFWTTAWSARIDAALLAGPAILLLLEAARTRDGQSLRGAALLLPLLALLAVLGNNPPYVGATVEIFSAVQPIFLPGLAALLLATPVAMALLWRWGASLSAFYRRSDWVWHLLLFLPAAFVVLWSTLPNPWRTEGMTRAYQEIIWFSSASLTPLLYWMALAGMGLVLWRRAGAAQGFLLLCLWGLGAAYFLDYTSAPLYPISLRRLLADLLPLLVLLAGQALLLMPGRAAGAPWLRPLLQGGVAAAALLWMGVQMAPLYPQHEAQAEPAFVAELEATLPADAVVIFEPQDADSWIGWLAAPLYSFHNRAALVLESDSPDPALLAQALAELQAAGRPVIVASQQDPLPAALTPPGVQVEPFGSLTWQSTLIGQSRTPWPPSLWEFAHPLHLYRVTQAEP
jgi:hypothetical protein